MSVGTEIEQSAENTEAAAAEAERDAAEHAEAPPSEPHDTPHERAHPSDGQYVVVAIILATITALEVWTYFWEEPSTALLVAVLVPMMIAKFAIVCGWFMHLRYDNPLFRRVFVFGLVLAVAVYLIAMSTLHWFQPAWTQA